MTDKMTREQRSYVMSRIKSKDSKIEMTLRRTLWNRGHRYRIHYKDAPGKPDIAFPKQKVAVFVDSEFWHGYNWEERKEQIKSNRSFWIPKIERNMERDREVNHKLREKGWKVLRFWGYEIKEELNRCIHEIEDTLEERKKE